ncbi:PREDICTED: F-box protein At2g39490 [Theobroma cacao]|uniref:F-box protein At2g39490 n=1 Tax=Theobroma cacao TaxID=3641 RepID=A0AB32X3L9_THECC|nr:PREDICTED: F-box protein At2g39490 [Theobroma cacao]XP_017985002.1 PREDICTED: F-box protein At2g39490 [Theobroma cacao]
MGKKLRKKKKKNRNKKQNQPREINEISNQIENLVLEETNDDFISRLRDDILCQILSLVPFRCAVQTSLLSTRWRYVWRKAIELQGTIEDVPRVITSLLDPFDKLSCHRRIRLHFRQGSILSTIKDKEELHLNFCADGQETFSHFDWSLELNPQIPISDLSSCIKVLHLKSVNKLTRETVSSVVSKFQLLESLQISECKGLQSLYIEAGSRFRSLVILECLQLNDVYVFAYNLKELVFQGQLPWFWLKYSPHLECVILDFRYGPGYNPFACENLLSLLLAVKNVKTLTISGWLFKVSISKWLSSAGAIWERKDVLFNNLKELRWIDSSMENHSIATLVSVLRLCPSLEKLVINVDPASYCSPSKGECSFWKEYSNRVANTATLDHLNMVKLKGFLGQEDEILLAERLVEVASVELIHVK